MLPITDIGKLAAGDVLYNEAVGLALLDRVADDAVVLQFEEADQRSRRCTPAALLSDWQLCVPGGFVDRALRGASRLRQLLIDEPERTAALLLDDLGDGLSEADVRRWTVRRGLLSAQRFGRWWRDLGADDSQALVGINDERLWLRDVQQDALSPPALFLASRPAARFLMWHSGDADTRAALLDAALDARDARGIRMLLRDPNQLAAHAESRVLDLALTGSPSLCAALLLRRNAGVVMALARAAEGRERRGLVRRALAALPPFERSCAALDLLNRAMSQDDGEVAALFLSTQLPGGAAGATRLIQTVPDADQRWPHAQNWVQQRVSESTLTQAVAPPTPMLHQLRPLPPNRIFPVAIATAKAMAERHAAGGAGGLLGARVHADGRVELGESEDSTPQRDVRNLVRLITELAIGTMPKDPVETEHLVVHMAQLLPAAPIEWGAVAARALSSEPSERPTDALDLWEQLEHAAATARVRQAAPTRPASLLQVGHDTHIGRVKGRMGQTNQDALFWRADGALAMLVVADGISVATAGRGDLASALLVQVLSSKWEMHATRLRTAPGHEIHSFLDDALATANKVVCEAALRMAGGDLGRHIPMGSTAVVAMVRGTKVYIASLGDSRAWIVGSNGAAPLTGDENVRGAWLRACQRGQATTLHRDGHALVGYVGHFNEDGDPAPLPPQHRTEEMLPGETLLMCSDGLTDYAARTTGAVHALLEEAARNPKLDDACRWLVDRANQGGGGDNITVLMARHAFD